jgi:hypothetical protein
MHMTEIMNPKLSSGFLQKLEDDGFRPIGWFEILENRHCRIHFNPQITSGWEFTIYLLASFRDGGKALRIGKSENYELAKRLIDWPCMVGDALSEKIFGKKLKYKGGTPPWEANGWLEYTPPYGLLFAQRIEPRDVLHAKERELITRYDPPMCNDGATGRMLAKQWRSHSTLIEISKGRGQRRNPHRCPAGTVCPLSNLPASPA